MVISKEKIIYKPNWRKKNRDYSRYGRLHKKLNRREKQKCYIIRTGKETDTDVTAITLAKTLA